MLDRSILHSPVFLCKNRLLKALQAIPLVLEIVSPTLERYGFEKNQGGAMSFVAEIQKHSGEDQELQEMVRRRALHDPLHFALHLVVGCSCRDVCAASVPMKKTKLLCTSRVTRQSPSSRNSCRTCRPPSHLQHRRLEMTRPSENAL